MTNHMPSESETFIQHYGKKKKAFRIVSWKDVFDKVKKDKKEEKKTKNDRRNNTCR